MDLKVTIRSLSVVLGIASLTAGSVMVYAYLVQAVYDPTGSPDRSLLFWMIPVLGIGTICIGTGAVLVDFGLDRRTRKKGG